MFFGGILLDASISRITKHIFRIYWKPTWDLAAVAVSWLLVIGALYTAGQIIGPEVGGGLPYFALYGVVTATLCGVGIPLFWMIVVRGRPLSDLGITTRWLALSLAVQMVLAALQYMGTLAQVQRPSLEQLVPLAAMALAIGFFEALFWRGWVLLRLEEAFGILPAILLSSLMYAVYHVGYGMPLDEMVFLFFIGILFAVIFRLTKNVFILWPVFQPMGQLVTLVRDQLTLPLISTLGFVDILVVMLVLVWLAGRYYARHEKSHTTASAQASA